MQIVVVESPAKAKTINKYLGPGYQVIASFGHVRDLPPKDGSVDPDQGFDKRQPGGWAYNTLPYIEEQTIHDLGLELQIIFNKGAVMILPTGVNKATGLCAALEKLGISRHNVVGVGDAENDEAFLKMCEASAAVDNALEVVKKQVHVVTQGARGEGVTEIIDRLLADDLATIQVQPA